MSFVTLGGEASARPTFFELLAADKLLPSLKSAITYSLSVYAQRRPSLLRLLNHEDEVFFLVSAWLNRGSLRGSDASFSEALYALHRVPADGQGTGQSDVRLTRAQRISSLALLTLVPYIRSKLDALYERRAPDRGALAALGVPEPGRTPSADADDGWRRLAFRAFLRAYPWTVAGHEGLRFLYQLLYLMGQTRYYSPGLHLLGLTIGRVTPATQAAMTKTVAERRAGRLAAGAALAWPLRKLRSGVLQTGSFLADNSRNALVLSVFAFKLLEWWYTSGEQALDDGKPVAPPPPPPALPPCAEGVTLPEDATLCPICRRERTNPAVLAPSGYVFCYVCVHKMVSETGACPVTLEPAKIDDIWRLYPGM